MGAKEALSKRLAICIPNYNRPEKLGRLLRVSAGQISAGRLSDVVEICVSDDCSTQKPQPVIHAAAKEYPGVDIRFRENEKNMGMDDNFLNSVLMSDAEYCWIIGNDDVPEPHALEKILRQLDYDNDSIDFLLCPFDCYDENDVIVNSIYPIWHEGKEVLYFDTKRPEMYDELLDRVQDGNGLFCFLSNVIFKRAAWIRHGDMFQDKMDSIFIQMYMNLQTLKEGAVYAYTPEKLIRNYSDADINRTFERPYDILVGLNGVVEYFFQGKWHRRMQKRLVDPFITGRTWDLPEDSPLKQPLLRINSPKADLYNRRFVRQAERKRYFDGKDVFVYGAGRLGHRVVPELERYNAASLSVFDADECKWGKQIEGIAIENPQNLYPRFFASKNPVVVIANAAEMLQIAEMLRAGGIENIALIT